MTVRWRVVEVEDGHERPMYGEDVTVTVVPYSGTASLTDLFDGRDALDDLLRRLELLEEFVVAYDHQECTGEDPYDRRALDAARAALGDVP